MEDKKDWVLEIETRNSIKKIKNPRKARASDLIVRCIVKIMDGDGKWHFVGHSFYESSSEIAANCINEAIKKKKEYINVEERLY